MSEKNKNEDRTQAPKSRPRPEVKRPIVPPPGGLPLPPSRRPSVPPPSSILTGSGTTSSNIETSGILPRTSEIRPTSSTMPTDLFGLPEFRSISIASTSKTSFGVSSIKSPTHLPGLANIKIPRFFGSFAAPSGIAGSSLQTPIQLPRPPTKKLGRDPRNRDLPGTSASAGKDLPKRAKRPTDLPLFNVPGTSGARPSSDPPHSDTSGASRKKNPPKKASEDLPKSSRTSDRVSVADSVPTSIRLPGPSVVESNPELVNLPGTSTMNQASALESIHLPGPSTSTSSELHDSRRKLDKRSSDPTPTVLPRPSEIKRSGDSMSGIAQNPGAIPKSKSVLGKFKRFVKRGFGVKKGGGREDSEEGKSLVAEGEDDQEHHRPQARPQEPEPKYKPFPKNPYNHFLNLDRFLPEKELWQKCQIRVDVEYDTPTESVISNTSSYVSEPDLASASRRNSESQAAEPVSKSNPVSPTTKPFKSNPVPPITEQTSKSDQVSPAAEQTSKSDPVSPAAEQTSKSDPVSPAAEQTSISNPVPPAAEQTSISNPVPPAAEQTSISNPVPPAAEQTSISNPVPPAAEQTSISNPVPPSAERTSIGASTSVELGSNSDFVSETSEPASKSNPESDVTIPVTKIKPEIIKRPS